MKQVVKALHVISAIIPGMFSILLMVLFLSEFLSNGVWPNTVHEEAPKSVLRSVVLFAFVLGMYTIATTILFTVIRKLIWRTDTISKSFYILMLISILSMIFLVYVNPGKIFTWMMG